jgi:ABC-type histidine transport system ATPase subunit
VGFDARFLEGADELPRDEVRVAARALAIPPRLMLFDKPTSALDPELVFGILALIRGAWPRAA